ncbi:MAG: YbjN domain-containing protein [Fimbriimonadaceae bacterium]|nr:YbjN domain-containing protein [Fimbriimonadaceae bacterium]
MGYLLSELTGPLMKSWFDAAFIDCRLDRDGDLVVESRIKIIVTPHADRKLIHFFALFSVQCDRLAVLEVCNRFNRQLVMVRASVLNDQLDGGSWRLMFDHEKYLLESEALDPKHLVRLVRKLEEVIVGGILEVDDDDLF